MFKTTTDKFKKPDESKEFLGFDEKQETDATPLVPDACQAPDPTVEDVMPLGEFVG